MKRHLYILWTTGVITTIALVGLLMVLLRWQTSRSTQAVEHPNYTVSVLDVGQGDSIFVTLEDGTQVLVDGGQDARVLSELSTVMPLWDRSLDMIVATHPHADHVGGLIHVLERFQVDTCVLTFAHYDSFIYDMFLDTARAQCGRIVTAEGQQLVEGPTTITMLYPSPFFPILEDVNVNETSIVLAIDDGYHTTLLTGDIGEPVEALLADIWTDIDVLKVGHQGSKYSSTRTFLQAIQPEYAIISVGADNAYHHPHPTVLKRLDDQRIETYRTDLHGTVTVESYDTHLNIEY